MVETKYEKIRSHCEKTCLGKWYGPVVIYEGWNFNIGNYLFTTDTK